MNELSRLLQLAGLSSSTMITESVQEPANWSPELPELYFRGSPQAMRSAYLTKLWRAPSPDLPASINELLSAGKISRVNGLSYNIPFKISRTYSGMSNWGYGIYFASSLDWALRYGTSITAVQVDPTTVMAIRADDFAQERPDTLGGELRKRLTAKTGGGSMRDEAPIMAAMVRSMKRNARALYVGVAPDQGQICVFSAGAVIPKYYFEMN